MKFGVVCLDTGLTGSGSAPEPEVFCVQWMAALATRFGSIKDAASIWLCRVFSPCADNHVPRVNAQFVSTNTVIDAHSGRYVLTKHFVGNAMRKDVFTRSVSATSASQRAIGILRFTDKGFWPKPKPAAARVVYFDHFPKPLKERPWLSSNLRHTSTMA